MLVTKKQVLHISGQVIVLISNSEYSLTYVVTTIFCTTFSTANAQAEAECRTYCNEDCSKYYDSNEFRACVDANVECDCSRGLPPILIAVIGIFGLAILILISSLVYYLYSKKSRSGQYRGREPVSVPMKPLPRGIYNSPSNGALQSDQSLAAGMYSTPITSSNTTTTRAAHSTNTSIMAVQPQPSLNPYFVEPVESPSAPGIIKINASTFPGPANINLNDAPPAYDAVFEKH